MNITKYVDKSLEYLQEILAIDSPTGYTGKMTDYLENFATSRGFAITRFERGGCMISIGGKDSAKSVALGAHIDTLGAMVTSVAENGELYFASIGKPLLPTLDGEYCRIRTRDDRCYTGTILSRSPAFHVYTDAFTRPRDEANMYIRLDAEVATRADVSALGIDTGDYVCFDTKTTLTDTGFVKSRFLDDKASVSMMLALLDYMHTENISPAYHTSYVFTGFEEIGHGIPLPCTFQEFLVVDMGCIGPGLACTEYDVSICPKDTAGPYDYEMTTRMVNLAKQHGVRYCLDVYPIYFSDAASLWNSQNDTKTALIGTGVHASHGMERAHRKGMENTIKLAAAYMGIL